MSEEIRIGPQEGPQTDFLSTGADICVYGGAAGGGKSYALLLEPLRHIDNPEFGFVCFRRTMNQITSEGGLWDTARKLYPHVGAKPVKSPMPQWRFPSGAKGSFSHLQYDDDVHGWQGSQIPLVMFDELTHFSKSQFFYMLSRNRSASGVKPYIRATTNPDSESWLADFIAWWIDQDTGYPIPEHGGVIRYFIRINDIIYWGDSREELVEKYNVEYEDAKSFTFIPSSIYDNQALLKVDPGYLANLKSLPTVERERLLGGNWKIKPAAGLYFKRSQVTMVETIPEDVIQWVRRWDLAATEVSENNPTPDWTAGVLMGKRKNGRYIIADLIHTRQNSGDVRNTVKNTAAADKSQFKTKMKVGISQDPGQAGKDQAESYVKMLSGYSVTVYRETGDKVTRSEPLASQWQNGNVDVLIAPWNNTLFSELEGFPELKHDDIVDSCSGAFSALQSNIPQGTPPKDMLKKSSYWKNR